MLIQSHAEQNDQWDDDPGGVGGDDHGEVRGAILPEGFFAENHDDAGDHGDGVDDAGQTDPFFAFDISVDGDQVKWAVQQVIEPDGDLEKGLGGLSTVGRS